MLSIIAVSPWLMCCWPLQDDNMMTREQLKQKYKSVQDLEDDFM